MVTLLGKLHLFPSTHASFYMPCFLSLVRKTKVFQPPKPSKFDRNVHISEVNLPEKGKILLIIFNTEKYIYLSIEKKSSEYRSFENIWKPLYASNKIIEDFQEFDEPEIITVENIHKYRETRPTSFNLSKILKATMMVGEI